jgi:hypothetical protein
MTSPLDRAREQVLDRMERADRTVRLAAYGAALVEMALMLVALLILDWHDKLQVELFLFSVMGYTIVVLGLVALGGHMTKIGGRILAVLDAAPTK